MIGAEMDSAAVTGGLDVVLDRALPASLPVGPATALFCLGTCFHRRHRVADLDILVNGDRHRPIAQQMPRLDRFRALHPYLSPQEAGTAKSDPDSPRDPELRSYRSGFWATVPIPARERSGELKVTLEARLADGSVVTAPLATVAVVERPQPLKYESRQADSGKPLVAICMATYNPNMDLFRTQVESIRAQTYRNWVCVVSDDCSEPAAFEQIAECVAGDGRFLLSRADTHLSFFRNFERALELAPAEAEFMALCDQDDYWYPEKIDALCGGIGSAELAYSDLRRVDIDGRVRAESLWEGRRNNHTNLASLLISNSIVGASCLIRRRAVERALPFPSGPGWDFHDHWLACVALALGEVAYVDRALYEYVQHPGAVLGRAASGEGRSGLGHSDRPRLRERVSQARGFFSRWRSAYFSIYLQREFYAQLILRRCGGQLTRRKRWALRLLAAGGRSPVATLWLAVRPVRSLLGRNETLGLEALLVRGILWRHLIALRTWGRQRPGGSEEDASVSSTLPQNLVPRQRRWLARR